VIQYIILQCLHLSQ